MDIQFEGKAYSFPDDFSPEEIGRVLDNMPKPADWWTVLKSIPGTAYGQAQQSIGGGVQAAGDLLRVDGLSEAGKGMRETGKINQEDVNPGQLSYWQRAVQSGMSSVIQQAPALAASVITGGMAPALIAAGGLTFGQTYGEAKEAGLGGLRAGTTAGVDAAVEVIMERIPLKFLLDNAAGPILKTIAGTILKEVPTELMTTALQQANAKLNHKPDMTGEEYIQGLLDTFGATVVSAPMMAGAARVMSPLGPKAPIAGDVPDQTAQGTQPGDNNPPLSPPANVAAAITPPGQTPPPGYDIPTGKPTLEQQAQIKELLAGLNPDEITDEQVNEARATLASIEQERAAPPKEVKEANSSVWGPFLNARTARDTNELAQTRKAAANAANYQNPNDLVPPDELTISFGPAEQIGKKLNETTPQKTTYVVGEPTEDRSAEYLGKLQETIEGWRQKYLPDSTIVLSNETLFTDSATGWHYSEPGFHTIIPAVIRNLKSTDTFNTDTQRSAFLNAAHEFGHALLSDRFFEGVDPVVAGQIMKLSENGTVSEDLIAQMPEAQQKVLREFNALKKRIMNKTMTAQEFLERWANPNLMKRKGWLSGLNLLPTSSAFEVGATLAKRAVENHRRKLHREGQALSVQDAKVLREQLIKSYFSLHEYIAEQTTKHAYTNKWDQTSPLGQWFKNAMEGLRRFFTDLKKNEVIAPGVAFQEWLEGLTATDRQEKAPEQRVKERKEKTPKAKKVSEGKPLAKPKKEAPAKAAPKKVKRTQANVESDTNKPKDQVARGLVVNMVRDGVIEKGDDTYKELMQLVKDQDWDAFRDMIQPLLGKKVKFSMDNPERDPMSVLISGLPEEHARNPKIIADAIKEWVAKGFRSKYFKAWFGDWEDSRKKAFDELVSRGGYYYHSVRNDADIPLIMQNGLLPGTNLSRGIGGQAFEDEAGTILVFKQGDVFASMKGYQDDAVAGAPAKPIAILKNTGWTRDPAFNEARRWEQLELVALNLEEEFNSLGARLGVKGDDLAVMTETQGMQLADELWPQLQKLYQRQRLLWQQMDGVREDAARPTEESVLAPLRQFGLPLYAYETEYDDATDKLKVSYKEPKKDHSQVLDGEGKPLILFHWTNMTDLSVKTGKMHDRVGFLEFKKGDIGFHFGTVRAAHIRSLGGNVQDYYNLSDEQVAELESQRKRWDSGWMIPVVLNIRNPLDIGMEHQSFWAHPSGTVAFLETFHPGLLTPQDVEFILENTGDRAGYSAFGALREVLLQKGYDGIKYSNQYEGDTTYVAFHPNQVKSVIGNSTFSGSSQLHMELDYDRGSDSGTGASGLFKGVKNFLADPGPLRRALRNFQNLGFKAWSLQQLALLHPDLPELLSMNQANTAYNAYKSKLQAKADAVLGKWKDLGKENFAKVNKFLLDEMRGGELWVGLQRQTDGTYVYVPTDRTAKEMALRGIDVTTEQGAAMAEIILEAKNALLGQLNEVENVLSTILSFRYIDKPEGMKAAFLPMVRQIHELRKQPFFPQGRFGNWMVTVERKDAEGHWKVVHREAFESQKEWEEASREMQAKRVEGLRVRSHKLTDSKYVLMGLPQDFLDVAASELDLTESQVEHLTQLLQPIKTEKALRPYEMQKLGITGYSEDAMRSFANYTWHNANLLAKMRYRSIFGADIRSVRSRLRAAQYAGNLKEIIRLEQVAKYMESTRDFIMAPPYEAQAVRAVVSIGYLAYNIKTALINFYGLVTTWSDLATRQGLLAGSAALARATKHSWQSIDWAGALTLDPEALNVAKKGLPPELQQALDQALSEGVLSQSYAYHLAGMANSSNLFRLPAVGKAGQIGQKLVDVGMYPFRLVELSTRRITFLAEYESALRDKKMNPLEAYQSAVDRTNLLQNDYSLGNRAPFMRGIKTQSGNKVVEAAVPLATVFMTFMQHMAFHAYGLYEVGQRRTAESKGHDAPRWFNSYTAKIWIITLLLAGYEGLPGAENLIDLLEAAWRKWGGPKPLRQMMREFIQSVDGDPVFWSRGLGHNVGGFDISRSVGIGRFVPGTDALAHPRDNVAETVGVLALDAMGATGGFIKFGLETLFNDKKFSENIGRMPGGVGNIIAAVKWGQDGVKAPSGAQITHDLKTGELRDLTADEILGKALGFNPTIVSQNREERFAKLDRKIYWSERRKMLLDDYWKAHLEGDREAIADTKRAIEKYNSKIPPEIKGVKITGKDIQQSLQARRRQFRADEHGTTPQKRYRGVYEDVGRSYGPPE